jgi:hypothetical protein
LARQIAGLKSSSLDARDDSIGLGAGPMRREERLLATELGNTPGRHGIENLPVLHQAACNQNLVRQLVLPHFLQASQAILTIEIFDKCPHDRTPLLVVSSSLDPALFQQCVAALGKWFPRDVVLWGCRCSLRAYPEPGDERRPSVATHHDFPTRSPGR